MVYALCYPHMHITCTFTHTCTHTCIFIVKLSKTHVDEVKEKDGSMSKKDSNLREILLEKTAEVQRWKSDYDK